MQIHDVSKVFLYVKNIQSKDWNASFFTQIFIFLIKHALNVFKFIVSSNIFDKNFFFLIKIYMYFIGI
jgi:hypothetical protein